MIDDPFSPRKPKTKLKRHWLPKNQWGQWIPQKLPDSFYNKIVIAILVIILLILGAIELAILLAKRVPM